MLSASLNQLWSLINGLQIFVYMPLMNVRFPANANSFIFFLVKIATFDVLPTDYLFDKIFAFPDDGAYNMNFAETKIESYYAVENLGTLFVIYNVYAVLVFI